MKLLSSFVKELKLASQSFYFFIEIMFAIIILIVVLFAIPEDFKEKKDEEYLYFEGPKPAEEYFIEQLEDLDGVVEYAEIKNEGEIVKAKLYEDDEKLFYWLDNKEDVISIADNKGKFGAAIFVDETTYETSYEYYTQGYETERFKNLLLVFHVEDSEVMRENFDNQDVRMISADIDVLSDRENVMPSLLTFNGSLMGLFILASYIFLDKKEGVIKAYAVTPSPVWQYLLSKVMVVTVTAIITTFIIVIPVLGASINYGLLLIFLATTGLFFSALGLYIAGFYEDFAQSFGVIYTLMIVFGLPIIAYHIPSWDPLWVKFFPTYHVVYGFKEIIVQGGDAGYVLWVSLGAFVAGTILFLLSNMRYKRTLSV